MKHIKLFSSGFTPPLFTSAALFNACSKQETSEPATTAEQPELTSADQLVLSRIENFKTKIIKNFTNNKNQNIMKKFATTFLIFSMVFCWVQISNAQCVQCDTSSQATGINASVIGTNTLAIGDNSFAGGLNSLAEGDYSFAFGENCDATGNHSFALGYDCQATENYAFAFGKGVSSTQVYSFSFGKYAESTSAVSFAMGTYVNATNQNAFTIGKGNGFSNRLVNNIENSLMIGFESTLPTFFVEPASGNGLTGRIGIGNVTEPEAKLHVRADAGEDANIKLENNGENTTAGILFGNGDMQITASEDMEFQTEENRSFRFTNGDIFIEDIDHGIVMKSPNGSCWRGTLTDEGQLQFTEVDCDELTVSTPEPEPGQNTGIRIYPNPTKGSVSIESLQVVNNANWILSTLDGTLLTSGNITSDKVEISLEHFVAGIYVLSIGHNGRIITSEKVVKQ